jgi:hypothetical protein
MQQKYLTLGFKQPIKSLVLNVLNGVMDTLV